MPDEDALDGPEDFLEVEIEQAPRRRRLPSLLTPTAPKSRKLSPEVLASLVGFPDPLPKPERSPDEQPFELWGINGYLGAYENTDQHSEEKERALKSYQAGTYASSETKVFLSSLDGPTDEELDEIEWIDRGSCVGVETELFFPERGASTKESKGVCQGCAVRNQCLELALDKGEKFGIWGGLSERERRRIRRQRVLARAAQKQANPTA